MGFSPWGLIVSVVVLVPNLLLVWLPPQVPLREVHVPRLLGWLERAGQALCLVVPAITLPGQLVWGWAAVTLVAVAGYYALWGRYLRTGRRGPTLYRSWLGVPVPMAILPVVAFLTAAAWLGDVWIAVAAGVLAAGHIPASLVIARANGESAPPPR